MCECVFECLTSIFAFHQHHHQNQQQQSIYIYRRTNKYYKLQLYDDDNNICFGLLPLLHDAAFVWLRAA